MRKTVKYTIVLNKNQPKIITESFPEDAAEECDLLPISVALQKLPEDLKKVIFLRHFIS